MQVPPANDLTSLGSAGLLIYLVVKEALAFSKTKKNGKTIGDMDPSYWELKLNQIVKEQNEPICEGLKEISEKLDKVRGQQIDTNYAIAQLLLAKGIMPQKQKEE